MEKEQPVDFTQFLNFDSESSSFPIDLEQLQIEPEQFSITQSGDVSDPYLTTSALDPGLSIYNCPASSAQEGDHIQATSFSGVVDLPINIPSFWRPKVPCDYCLSRQLNCIFTVENQNNCTSCTSLFRACSFTNPQARAAHGYLDTLSSVVEDSEQAQGGLTSTKPLFSLGASMNDILDNILKTQPERATTRFARSTTLVLKRWLEAHSDNPYPTEEEKDALKEQTGLSRNQISNWLANARRRGKVKPKRCVSPSLQQHNSSEPINIPRSSTRSEKNDQAHLTPFERWKISPTENDPAPIAAITRAAADTRYPVAASGSSSQTHSVVDPLRSSNSAGSMFRAPSNSSMETPRSSGSMASTSGSAHSYGSRSSYNSFAGRDRRRRRRTVPKNSKRSSAPSAPKIFQCTFCTDTFHIKYDWSRHEKSLHLSLEKWICAPLGPIVTSTADGSVRCVYCQLLNPPPEHFDTHNFSECKEKGLAARTFFRKDHLRQHLRLIHNVPLSPEMEAWKSAPVIIRSRCGFCPPENPTTFTTWQDRADHLAEHFKRGAQMSQWKGDWGFDPEIASHVTNAMPPWMIGEEYNTPNPFTATGGDGQELPVDVERESIPQAEFALGRARSGKVSNCWEVLTVLLGKFVREQLELGNAVTDALLQRQARLFIFDDDDEWNQTAADNVEWLKLFKQAHGLCDGSKELASADDLQVAPAGIVEDDAMAALTDPTSPNFQGHIGRIEPSFTSGDMQDEEFQKIFEDAGLFNMEDLQQMPFSTSMPASLSMSSPVAPSYLNPATWTMHSSNMGSMDGVDDDFDDENYMGSSF